MHLMVNANSSIPKLLSIYSNKVFSASGRDVAIQSGGGNHFISVGALVLQMDNLTGLCSAHA